MKQLTYVVILLCLGVSSIQCSSPPPRCVNGISSLTINPHKLLCTNHCDCNNQNYTGTCKCSVLENDGSCVQKTCDSDPRGTCPKEGMQRPCEAGSGFQICKARGLKGMMWGDCQKYCESATDKNCVCRPTTKGESGLAGKDDCNGKDDDCDGTIDNKPGTDENLIRPCYEKGKGCELQKDGTFACTKSCQSGTQTCVNGNWQPCKHAMYPKLEECNGKDDDCNGQVDDIAPTNTPMCRNQLSNCMGARLPASACKNGKWRRCNVIDYQKNSAEKKLFFNTEDICDQKDNNCDGRVDESPTCKFSYIAGWVKSSDRNGLGVASRFDSPKGIAFDSFGSLYVADADNHKIRKIDACGNVTTFAGHGSAGTNNGNRKIAQFHFPYELVFGPQGNLYIADAANHRIRKVDLLGNVTTFAGEKPGYQDGSIITNNVAGKIALFQRPIGIAFDQQGNLHVVDSYNNRIRKIDRDGNVTTTAGSGTKGFLDGGPQEAQFNRPHGLAIDDQGNLYVADIYNHRIRKIDSQGNVTTYAGSGIEGFQDGPAKTAKFKEPHGLMFDGQGNLYVTDYSNSRIRMIDSKGENVTTVLAPKHPEDGFPRLMGLTSSPLGEMFFICNEGVCKFHSPSHKAGVSCVTKLAGSKEGLVNGPLHSVQFHSPNGIAFDAKGNMYVSDSRNFLIRKLDTQGNVSTFAGSGTSGFQDGGPTTAQFKHPRGLVSDSKGDVYVADAEDHRIRKIGSEGNVTTFAGSGEAGFQDGPGKQAQFKNPCGLAVDSKNNVYIADSGNHRIRKIDTKGTVITFAGSGTAGFQNGAGNKAQFKSPCGLAFDNKGNLFVADVENHRIRKIDTKGNVTTFAGSGEASFKDGPSAKAQFDSPQGLAFDSDGNLYVADINNHRIRKIDRNGNVSTYAGSGKQGIYHGPGYAAKFDKPGWIAIDQNDNLYVSEPAQHRIRKISVRGIHDHRRSDRKQGESCDLADPTLPGHHKCISPLHCNNNQCK